MACKGIPVAHCQSVYGTLGIAARSAQAPKSIASTNHSSYGIRLLLRAPVHMSNREDSLNEQIYDTAA